MPLPRNRVRATTVVLLLAAVGSSCSRNPETARWEQEARDTTIVRDDWGIAHIYGKTDADTVFGTVYAQAEDEIGRASCRERV